MKTMQLLLCAVLLLWGTTNLFAQGINSSNPKMPFGSNLSYDYGIMPTNLPKSGTYGRSQAAADQYEYWVTNYVEKCNDGSYRVKFDNPDQTVSEGIAYGMLLSVYAGDKVHFDGFWKFFKNSMNGNGLMNWMTDGCDGNARDNAATDADLDAAHALIIAAEQWPADAATYEAEAKTLLGDIMTHEIDDQSYLTLSGDAWGSDACLNPSYQSPAYYRQYALVDVTNASKWASATTAAEDLLDANANSTTGLVSNWCTNTGVASACGPNNPYSGYGSDACRTPWRMATDVLWHGKTTATTGYSLSKKMSDWLAGYETNLRGQMDTDAANPSVGAYSNGSYTTFALSPMAMDDSYQESLNKCYSFTAAMSHDGAYFNETVRCLTLFVLTGNFWAPGTSGTVRAPEVLSAESNEDGTQITVTFTKDINTSNLGSASNFVVSKNGVAQSGAVQSIVADGTSAIILTVTAGTCEAGKSIELDYTGSSIQSADGAQLGTFSDQYVKNNLLGNSTMIDNCEDGNATNMIGGVWYTFDDSNNSGLSTVTPESTEDDPMPMTGAGADGSVYSAKMEFHLDKGGNQYDPFVGIGTSLNGADLTGTTGMTFWYRGAGCYVKPILSTVTDYAHYSKYIDPSSDWKEITLDWTDFNQPSNWGIKVDLELDKILEFQWQVEGSATTINQGDKFLEIDFVECNGLVPTDLVSMVVEEATDVVGDDFVTLYVDPDPSDATQVTDTTLHITYTPANATYKEVIWNSANPSVASIKFNGEVTAISSGTVKMTATAGVDEEIVAEVEVKVIGLETLPTSLTITDAVTELDENATVDLGVIIEPFDADNKNVVWTSSDNTIATVDADGIVTGRGNGTVEITVASEADPSVTDKVTIQINGTVTNVTEIIIPATKTLNVAETFTFNPVVNPSNATDPSITWSTSDATKVSVDAKTGKITGEAEGEAVITATANDGSGVTATCSVTVSSVIVLATDVTLNKSTLILTEGDTETLIATVEPTATVTNSDVVWSSSAPTIASVDASTGEISALAKGDAIITATAADASGVKATCAVQVNEATNVDLVTSITIVEGNITLTRLETQTLTATVLPGTAEQTVSWSTSDDTKVEIDATTGEITAVGAGTATITATATDASGVTGTITVTVNPILVSGLTGVDAKTILVDGTATLSVLVAPVNADDQTVTWSTSDATKVSVNATTGDITGEALGSAIITATANDASGETFAITVTVTDQQNDVTGVTLDKSTISMTTGDSDILSATIAPANATNSDIIWQSSDVSVATVDQFGNVTAVGAGTATIKVISMDNTEITAVSSVTVSDIAVATISVETSSVSLTEGEVSAIVTTISPATATNTAVKYSSSAPAVATVSDNGVITAVGEGNAIITVSAADGQGASTTISVSVTGTGTTIVLVETIKLNEDAVEVKVGANATVSVEYVTPLSATNSNVIWTSSNTDIATVANGVITGIAVGEVVITAASADEGNAVSAVSVTVITDAVLVEDITSTTQSVSVERGVSETVAVSVSPAGASKTVTWASSDENVAIVDVNGKITGLKEGQAIITATATDGSKKVLYIPVNVDKPSSTTLANEVVIASILPMNINEIKTLVVNVYPTADASQSVTLISSNPEVISVDGKTITAKAAGEATITAIANDGSGQTDSEIIKVNAPVVIPTGITPSVDITAIKVGEVAFFDATVAPANVSDAGFIVSFPATGIIDTIPGKNAFKALAEGDVEVTFTAASNSTISQKVTISVSASTSSVLDKSGLENAIAVAEGLVQIYENSPNEYIAFQLPSLKSELSKANIIFNNSSIQETINEQTSTLLAEIEALNDIVIMTDVESTNAVVTTVSPSPATDVITLEADSEIANVSIVSINGTTLISVNANATSVELNVSELTTGVYTVVVVKADDSVETIQLPKL